MELLTNRVKLPRIFDLCNREMRDHFRKCPTVWRGLWIPFGHGPCQLLEGSPRSWGLSLPTSCQLSETGGRGDVREEAQRWEQQLEAQRRAGQ